MKTSVQKLVLSAAVISMIYSCRKGEYAGSADVSAKSSSAVSAADSVSSVATMTVPDRQFVKTAQVDMEVKNAYDATLAIEKSLADLGGFVVHSDLDSEIVSEKTYNTSDTDAVIVRKFQSHTNMEVRVPTEQLGSFLQSLSDKKIFLHSRLIDAEDVTAGIKFAEMEAERNRKTAGNIALLKTRQTKVNLIDDNETEKNNQAMQSANLAHNLQYSVVDLQLKEPGISIAQIAVANTAGIDRQYSVNFWYDLKNALLGGYELLQLLIIGLFRIWPLLLIAGGIIRLLMRKQKAKRNHCLKL